MNHTIFKYWTCAQITEMFDWCVDHRIPVLHIRTIDLDQTLFYAGSRNRQYINLLNQIINNGASYPGIYVTDDWSMVFLVRDRDIALWTLRFGPSL